LGEVNEGENKMKTKTRLFGEIDIAQEKIITFKNGIIGFPQYRKYTLIYDEDKKEKSAFMWMQSLEEPELAILVMDPLQLRSEYPVTLSDEGLSSLGKMGDEDAVVFVTVTVPQDLTKMTANLKAPIIVNTATGQAEQLIVEEDYDVRHPIYDILKNGNQKEGE
jgi:flagellar assembly factor FliW